MPLMIFKTCILIWVLMGFVRCGNEQHLNPSFEMFKPQREENSRSANGFLTFLIQTMINCTKQYVHFQNTVCRVHKLKVLQFFWEKKIFYRQSRYIPGCQRILQTISNITTVTNVCNMTCLFWVFKTLAVLHPYFPILFIAHP